MQTETRSDEVLIKIAEHHLTSDRLTEMTSTGGQTAAVRPGEGEYPDATVQSN